MCAEDAEGEFDVHIIGGHGQNEIGWLARALAIFRDRLVEAEAMRARERDAAERKKEERSHLLALPAPSR